MFYNGYFFNCGRLAILQYNPCAITMFKCIPQSPELVEHSGVPVIFADNVVRKVLRLINRYTELNQSSLAYHLYNPLGFRGW